MRLLMLYFGLFVSGNLFAQNPADTAEIKLRIIQKTYENKVVSVEKIQINDWRWVWCFYNRKGEKTYEVEEFQGSYQCSVQPKYRDDGSVKSLTQTIHPGGSRFWYKNTITMDSSNAPLTLMKRRLPDENLSSQNIVQKWNETLKRWE